MKVLLILLLLLFLLAILPLGVSVQYDETGLFLAAHAGVLKIPLLPQQEKPKKKAKKEKKPKKETEKPEQTEKPVAKSSGGLRPTLGGLVSLIEEVVPALGDTLDRLRRKITVNELTLYYTSAALDPYDAAMHYGTVSAALEAGLPALRRWLRVKKCDTATAVSFDGTGDRITLKAKLTLRLWEIIYIALGTLPAIKAALTFLRESRGGKAEQNG